MQRSEFRKYNIFGQAGIWCILFVIAYMDELPYSSPVASFFFALNYIIMVAGVVYLHYFFVLPLYLKRKRIFYFLTTFALMSFFMLVYDLIDVNLPFEVEDDSEDQSPAWLEYFYGYLLLTLLVAVSSIYYFIQAWFRNTEKEANLKNQKLQAELNFLKSQINPHFLFNTLNNIYAFAQTDNPKTAPMLEHLSSILRFMVYDCGEERVMLTKELEAVKDLLEIYKMKNARQQNISLTTFGVKGLHLIAPLIIVNLVENAFKHSDAVTNPAGFIRISISVNEEDQCTCEVVNSIKKKIKTNSPYQGVGLGNIIKRLDLQYETNYNLETSEENNQYHLKLSIPLERKK